MRSEHDSGWEARQAGRPLPPRWQEMLEEFRSVRQVFHALCDMGEGEDATELLGFAVRQDWMAELAGRAQGVALLDDTVPCEPDYEDLQVTLWQLYAAGRIRDALLLAHQPGPAGDSVGELDEWLYRKQPCFRAVPVDQVTQFFAAIGCQPVTDASFDPILHEIITCEAAVEPDAPIRVTGHVWPALMIGELVFTRAGVHVQAGSEHAVSGIADRSVLQWEYWRRHRTTNDRSFGWGHNSQWRTDFRRDYITSRGHIYNFDALSGWHQHLSLIYDPAPSRPLTASEVSYIKNRCQLRGDDVSEPGYLDHRAIDERRL